MRSNLIPHSFANAGRCNAAFVDPPVAATIVAATGGSTNAALHLPAIANEIGIKFDLMDVAKIFKKTPYLADLKPGGKYVAKDMWLAGGVPMLLKTLYDGGFIHGDCMTVTGKTMKQNLKNIKFNPKQKVLRAYDNRGNGVKSCPGSYLLRPVE